MIRRHGTACDCRMCVESRLYDFGMVVVVVIATAWVLAVAARDGFDSIWRAFR